MFKRLFVVALFMVLSLTILPVIAKADAYEYENINELADSVASSINKKNTYTFKYKFSRSDFYADLDVNVNWKNKTVSFNGFIFRPETVFKKEKFYAVLDLNNNKVKTENKIYKKGNIILRYIVSLWDYKKGSEYTKSLGNYLLGIFEAIGKDTTTDKTADKIVVKNSEEHAHTTVYSAIIVNKSKVLDMEAYSDDGIEKLKLK